MAYYHDSWVFPVIRNLIDVSIILNRMLTKKRSANLFLSAISRDFYWMFYQDHKRIRKEELQTMVTLQVKIHLLIIFNLIHIIYIIYIILIYILFTYFYVTGGGFKFSLKRRNGTTAKHERYSAYHSSWNN